MSEHGTTIRVAIVDDNELLTDGLAAAIDNTVAPGNSATATDSPPKCQGPNLVVAYAGASPEAAAGERPDIALLDVRLGDDWPDIVENVSALRAAGAAVLLFSATAEPGAVRRGLQAGAVGYVPKMAAVAEVREAILAAATGCPRVFPELSAAILEGLAAGHGTSLDRSTMGVLRLHAAGLGADSIARRLRCEAAEVPGFVTRAIASWAQSN